MVMQGGYMEVYPGSGKGRPYVQRGGLQAVREGTKPRSQRKNESTKEIA
jgi:hypothetical protein